MRTVEIINFIIMCLFFACYSYQFFYIPVSLLGRAKPHSAAKLHRYAVLIAARHEALVIGQLGSGRKTASQRQFSSAQAPVRPPW